MVCLAHDGRNMDGRTFWRRRVAVGDSQFPTICRMHSHPSPQQALFPDIFGNSHGFRLYVDPCQNAKTGNSNGQNHLRVDSHIIS